MPIYKLCTDRSYKRYRRTKDLEEAPTPKKKAAKDTSKENLVSLSVSSNKGERGISCSSNPGYPKGTIHTQDLRAWCKQPPSAGRSSVVYFACWPSFKKAKLKSMWKKTYQQQCFISCTQFVCFFLLFLVRNHYE